MWSEVQSTKGSLITLRAAMMLWAWLMLYSTPRLMKWMSSFSATGLTRTWSSMAFPLAPMSMSTRLMPARNRLYRISSMMVMPVFPPTTSSSLGRSTRSSSPRRCALVTSARLIRGGFSMNSMDDSCTLNLTRWPASTTAPTLSWASFEKPAMTSFTSEQPRIPASLFKSTLYTLVALSDLLSASANPLADGCSIFNRWCT
mmetsp:Transcript_24377/g.42531  ORF Transcript_24377/g.42531 Transcript_24377/m.42531 type:complete len:201 (-) Transcript_24377:129-731(-)